MSSTKQPQRGPLEESEVSGVSQRFSAVTATTPETALKGSQGEDFSGSFLKGANPLHLRSHEVVVGIHRCGMYLSPLWLNFRLWGR